MESEPFIPLLTELDPSEIDCYKYVAPSGAHLFNTSLSTKSGSSLEVYRPKLVRGL
jgi:hypothetical protein